MGSAMTLDSQILSFLEDMHTQTPEWSIRESQRLHSLLQAHLADKAVAHETDQRVLWGVVANAGRLSEKTRPRWAHVMDATGLGSTRASELCVRFGFDPEEMRGGECDDG